MSPPPHPACASPSSACHGARSSWSEEIRPPDASSTPWTPHFSFLPSFSPPLPCPSATLAAVRHSHGHRHPFGAPTSPGAPAWTTSSPSTVDQGRVIASPSPSSSSPLLHLDGRRRQTHRPEPLRPPRVDCELRCKPLIHSPLSPWSLASSSSVYRRGRSSSPPLCAPPSLPASSRPTKRTEMLLEPR